MKKRRRKNKRWPRPKPPMPKTITPLRRTLATIIGSVLTVLGGAVSVMTMWPDVHVDFADADFAPGYGQPADFVILNNAYFNARSVDGVLVLTSATVTGSPPNIVRDESLGPI